MSATGRGSKRHEADFYETEPALALSTLEMLRRNFGVWHPGSILDPGAGRGVWGSAARRLWPDAYIVGIDLFTESPNGQTFVTPRYTLEVPENAYDMWLQQDLLKPIPTKPLRAVPKGGFDLIVGNPPYSLATQFVDRSFSLIADRNLISFLLRINFLGSSVRLSWWEKNNGRLGAIHTCVPRPSFKENGGSDATEYAIFTWAKGDRFVHGGRVRWLKWGRPKHP